MRGRAVVSRATLPQALSIISVAHVNMDHTENASYLSRHKSSSLTSQQTHTNTPEYAQTPQVAGRGRQRRGFKQLG